MGLFRKAAPAEPRFTFGQVAIEKAVAANTPEAELVEKLDTIAGPDGFISLSEISSFVGAKDSRQTVERLRSQVAQAVAFQEAQAASAVRGAQKLAQKAAGQSSPWFPIAALELEQLVDGVKELPLTEESRASLAQAQAQFDSARKQAAVKDEQVAAAVQTLQTSPDREQLLAGVRACDGAGVGFFTKEGERYLVKHKRLSPGEVLLNTMLGHRVYATRVGMRSDEQLMRYGDACFERWFDSFTELKLWLAEK